MGAKIRKKEEKRKKNGKMYQVFHIYLLSLRPKTDIPYLNVYLDYFQAARFAGTSDVWNEGHE
jgi:hypothetical protein